MCFFYLLLTAKKTTSFILKYLILCSDLIVGGNGTENTKNPNVYVFQTHISKFDTFL